LHGVRGVSSDLALCEPHIFFQ